MNSGADTFRDMLVRRRVCPLRAARYTPRMSTKDSEDGYDCACLEPFEP